jgi:copper chaperone CopZ
MFQMKVTGMTCSHCAAAVKQALMECKGVTAAEVDLASGDVRVDGTVIDPVTLVAAVRAAGYEVQQAGRAGGSVGQEPGRDDAK